MDSNSVVGLSELGAAARVALDVWKVYKGAPPNHKALSGDIASLHIVLKELQWQAQENPLGPNLQKELTSLVRQSQLVLKDLEALVEENTTSTNASQSNQDEWSKEDILEVKARLVSLTNLMIRFNSNITNNSVHAGNTTAPQRPRRASQPNEVQMEADLTQLLQQKIHRRHTLAVEHPVASSGPAARSNDPWKELVQELHGIGVSTEIIHTHKDQLINYSKDAYPVEVAEESTSQFTRPQQLLQDPLRTQHAQGSGSSWRPLSFLFSRWFIEAARAGDVTTLKSRLRFVKTIDCRDSEGFTALQLAVMHGHTPVVQVLLEEGADLVSYNWGAQALNVAAQNGYSEIVQCLLDKGVNVDAVDPNKSDYTPLLWAASRGHTDAVKVLVDSGARTHLIDDLENDPRRCCTALVYAATNGHAAVVQLILDIAPNCQTKARWLEVVFDITAGSWRFKIGMAHVLMKKGGRHIDEVIDRGGTTALHVAVDRNNLALFTQLLDKGANLEKRDVFKMTALHKAVRGGHAKMVRLLLERDANVGATTPNGLTALHIAIIHPPPQISAFDANQGKRSSRIVELLLHHGADVFKEDNHGKTPLDHLPSRDPQFNSLVNALLLAEMERFVMVPRPRGSSTPPPAYEEAQI